MKRHQMLMLMLRDTMMTWLLGRLGKVQLQKTICSGMPSSNHLLCQSETRCPCPDGRITQSTDGKPDVVQEQRRSAQRS